MKKPIGFRSYQNDEEPDKQDELEKQQAERQKGIQPRGTHLQHCVHRFGHYKYSVPVQGRQGNISGCHFRSGQGCRR